MQLSAPTRLPDFDQATIDRRFLLEVDRLLQAGAFSSYRDLAGVLGTRPGIFSEIESGRYHCNLKLLYALAQHYPQANVAAVLFGDERAPAGEPRAVPARPRGRRPATTKSARSAV